MIDSFSLPTPYYDRDGITIYCGDCREILPNLGRFDLLLTDPPYGLGDKWNGGGGSLKSSWRFNPDEAKSWDGKIVDGLEQLVDLANQSIVWGGNYYRLPPSRCWLIWDKKQPDNWTTGQAELAWTNFDKSVRAYRMAQCEAHNEMGSKSHPTQKPISLIKWCFKWADSPSSVVDPFMGSGTTLVAAKELGIRAVGIELNEKYCEIAVRRLAQNVLKWNDEQL